MRDRTHPFAGGIKKPSVTLRHRALMWENMLGTVYAMNAKGVVKYFDYDYTGARAFAGVDKCTDLRTSKVKHSFQNGPRRGQIALFGIR